MITFIDEKGTEHSALVAYSVTNAVNGELSVKGTIYTNDKVLHGIDRGWRFRLDDEYYRVTYAKPNDAGRQIEVEFDAVHQFFYDMSKSMVYDTLNGSKPFETYLQAIFSNSGYTYNLETTVGSIRKENFGNKSRLSLFNDIIKAAGLEFSVRGHVVRILKRIGTDLSTIVRKDFNMNELKIEKNINSFVTYQRGIGAWKDDEDHSKGRYESEYESPLAKIYGRIEAEPVVDERYKETGKLLERLKENVDKSYKVSVEIDMEDLSRAGYRLSRPNPGDFIMAINETLGFSQKVRIVSFTSEYDVGGNLISRKVVCNDIGSVQRRASEMSSLARSVQDVAAENAKAIATATKALVSADGKNTIYFSESKPRDEPVGTLRKGDQLYLKEGEKTNLYFWNGSEWELNPLEMDLVKFRKEYESKTKEINQSMATQTQQTAQALRTAGANASAIEAAKGAITKLNQDLAGAKQTNQAAIDRLKSDFASAQQAASDQTALLRSDLANIRTKQTQTEAEIGKQVQALNATKTELAGVKSAQSTFEQSTTRRLAELANVADGKASKSELVQTAQELSSRIASVQAGSSRNYFRNSRTQSFTTNEQATYDYRLFIVPDFWKNKDRLKRDYVRLSFDVTFPVALTRDTQANVHFSAHPWYAYRNLVFKGGTTERQHFEFTIDLSGAAETYQTNNVFIRFETNYGFPSGLQVVIENAMLSVSNYYPAYQPAYEDQEERVTAVESTFKQKADSLEAGVNRLTEGLKSKADSSALNLLSDRISASVKSLETNMDNKLDSKLSTAVFEVQASGIRQEIVNATKDKADKALVTAEAGKLREELASLQVGGTNLLAYANFNAGGYYQNSLKKDRNYMYSNLIEIKSTDYLLQIWELEANAKKTWAGLQFFDEQRNPIPNGYSTFWFNGYLKQTIKPPQTARYLAISFENLILDKDKAKFKLETGTLATDWSPAPEDTDGLITEAKATFERTAQGLRTDLTAVQAYVNADGTRAEALRTYSREETARQLTAERKAIESGYVAKATHTEDVRGLTRRFEELTVGGRNLMGVFNTKPVKSIFDRETYKFTAKTTQNTTRPTLMLQFRWTDGSYGAAVTISEIGKFARKFKITKPYSELRVKFNCNKEDAVLLFTGKQFIEQNTDYYFTGDLINLSPNDSQADFLKIEKATIPSSWSPAPEDATSYADTKLAEFRQDIDGQLASVQAAINTANGSLTNFNTWKQSAQETLNKVGKVETGLTETKTSLAEFKRTAEGQLTTISQQIISKASQTEFQRVQETSKLYERLIGSTEKEVTDKVSRMALTNELFQVEVSKNLGLRTVQYQIANAWAVQNLNSNGDIVSQINATGPNVRIQGESIHLDGKALIDNGIIKNAMIESMLADKITAGTLDAANVNIVNLNANKIVGLDANFIKSKIELALVDWLKGKVITAQNDAMKIDLNNGQYNVMTDQAAIRRVLSGYPNQFLKFTSETEGGAPASVTVLGANRDGTENSKNDSFAGIRLFSGNKVERTEIISDVVRFATGAVNYRGWEMRTLYGNDNRQVILQPFGNVTRSNIVANYFNGIDLTNVLETLNQMMANLANHTGRRDIFGPIPGLGARKYQR